MPRHDSKAHDCRQDVILDLGISAATWASSAIDDKNPVVDSASRITLSSFAAPSFAFSAAAFSLRLTALASPLSGF